MRKDISKVGQRRALGERKAAELEAKRTGAAPSPTRVQMTAEVVAAVASEALRLPPVKKKSRDPAVAAVERQIEEKKAQKEAKQSPRAGKKQIAVWLDEQLVKDLKHHSVEDGETIEAIVARGIEMALERWPR